MKLAPKKVIRESKFTKNERHEMYLATTDKYDRIANYNMGLCQALKISTNFKYEDEIFNTRKIDFPEMDLFAHENTNILGGYFWSFLQEDIDARLLGLAFLIAMSDDE